MHLRKGPVKLEGKKEVTEFKCASFWLLQHEPNQPGIIWPCGGASGCFKETTGETHINGGPGHETRKPAGKIGVGHRKKTIQKESWLEG